MTISTRLEKAVKTAPVLLDLNQGQREARELSAHKRRDDGRPWDESPGLSFVVKPAGRQRVEFQGTQGQGPSLRVMEKLQVQSLVELVPSEPTSLRRSRDRHLRRLLLS